MVRPDIPGVGCTIQLPTSAATELLGRRLGSVVPGGAWVLLSGELGSGKTVLARGVAAGMGVTGHVTSPTYVVVHEHPVVAEAAASAGGALPAGSGHAPCGLLHADLYRVRSAAEAEELALFEYADEGWAVAIEWPDRWPALANAPALHLRLSVSSSGSRELVVLRNVPWAATVIAEASTPQ